MHSDQRLAFENYEGHRGWRQSLCAGQQLGGDRPFKQPGDARTCCMGRTWGAAGGRAGCRNLQGSRRWYMRLLCPMCVVLVPHDGHREIWAALVQGADSYRQDGKQYWCLC